MSKKSKRIRARNKANQPLNIDRKQQANAVNTDIKPSIIASQRVILANQESQYKYIIPELVRISIIAGIFFIIIVVLSFILK